MTGRYGTQDAEYRADLLRYRGVPAALHAIIREARTAEQLIEHPFRHHQTPAAQAAAAPTPTEDRMQLSQIADALKNGAVTADNWMHEVLGQHVALVAEIERFQSNPIVQELEALGETMLPPGDVALITSIIRMAGRANGQSTHPPADVTQLPAGQGPEGAQPAWQAQPADGQQGAPGEPSSDPRNR